MHFFLSFQYVNVISIVELVIDLEKNSESFIKRTLYKIELALVLFFVFFMLLGYIFKRLKMLCFSALKPTVKFCNWLNYWNGKQWTIWKWILPQVLNSWSFNYKLINFQFFINHSSYYRFFFILLFTQLLFFPYNMLTIKISSRGLYSSVTMQRKLLHKMKVVLLS